MSNSVEEALKEHRQEKMAFKEIQGIMATPVIF